VHKSGNEKERGANLVEFALLAPMLIMLVFGIIEFAWIFAQNLDIRHGAREGARVAAVNFPVGTTNGSLPRNDTDRDAMIDEICTRMDIATGVSVDLQSSGVVGSAATATTTAPRDTLTGLLDWAIPPSLILSSSVEIRLEQPATWTNTPSGGQAC
jgi:Flp pilus assembly protein TadG